MSPSDLVLRWKLHAGMMWARDDLGCVVIGGLGFSLGFGVSGGIL